MTTSELLAYISVVLFVQVAAAIAFTIVRARWTNAAAPAKSRSRDAGYSASWTGLRAFRVVRRVFEDDARGQCSFYLEPVDGVPLPAFKAGQFLTFQLDLRDASGGERPVTRRYSLSDRHDPAAYRVTIKRIPPPLEQHDLPPGRVSNYFHDNAMPGSILQVRAPAGSFVLDEDSTLPVVLIAGGIGITPLFSMARAALAVQPDRVIHLIYGVRDRRELAFASATESMRTQHENFRMTIVQSHPLPGEVGHTDHQETGFIDRTLLQRLLPHGQHQFYVCGPPPMLASLFPALRDWGVAAEAVHYEAFGPASLATAGTVGDLSLDQPFEVRFARSGRTLAWTGAETNPLDFAEYHGIDVESGCRSGSCGMCETTISSGEVRYATPPSLEVSMGQCLLCVDRPTGDLVLDA